MTKKDLRKRALAWIETDPDPRTAQELRALLDTDHEQELAERMAGPLRFGTAGLRGIVGAGESRMNTAVILRTTAGLGNYLLSTGPNAASQGVVIGYDGRHGSREFAHAASYVLAGVGIKAHLFRDMTPTPLVAYAIGVLGAAAGVMVTASHNPKEYNGYKVYWSNGALIIPPHDHGIASAIETIGPAKEIPRLEETTARQRGLLMDVPDWLLDQYGDDVAALSLDDRGRAALTIVYTAMHGVGDTFAQNALKRYGFREVWSVPEQQKPDGDFPTVAFPNPEEAGALNLALALAKEKGAQLVLANDPDADRLAVAVPKSDGGYRQLSGNEVGVLLGEYILRAGLNDDAQRIVVTTIVSSPMLGEIAGKLGVQYAEVLTGFKWIVTTAKALENEKGARFTFGYEEALGYTIGQVTPDKDGISAAAIFAELTAVAATEGRTIDDELERLSRSYGLHVSAQRSITKRGTQGAAEIAETMDRLRLSPPVNIGETPVTAVRDYLKAEQRTASGGSSESLPTANVISFQLEGDGRVVARPSGTEPKIKFYFDLRETVGDDEPFVEACFRAQGKLDDLVSAFLEIVS